MWFRLKLRLGIKIIDLLMCKVSPVVSLSKRERLVVKSGDAWATVESGY